MTKFLLLLSVFLLLSCTKGSKDRSETLVIQLKDAPPTLDWHKATDTTSRLLLLNIMDPLFTYDFSTRPPKLVPKLALSLKHNKNYTQFEIKIKKSTWCDGVPVTSQHFVDAFERLLNPVTGALNASWYYLIENSEKYNSGEINDFKKVGVKANGDDSVSFKLNRPANYFPQLMTLIYSLPIRKDLILKSPNSWSTPPQFCGIGPYKLIRRKFGVSLSLEKNENYYGAQPKISKIEFKIVEEPATALNLFESKEIDVLTSLPLLTVRKFKDRSDFYSVPEYSIEYLGFNLKKKPFDSVEVRKAFVRAVNRTEIVQLLNANYQINSSFIPLGLTKKSFESELSYDPKESRRLLNELSNEKGLSLEQLTLSYYSDSNQKIIMERVQQQLYEAFGVRPTMRDMEWKMYLKEVNSDPPAVYRLGWMAIYPNPQLFLSLFTSKSHYNTSGFKDDSYDKIVKEFELEPSPDQREKLIQQAMKILIDQQIVVFPLFSGAQHFLINERVKDFPLNPMNRMELQHTSLK